MFSLSFYQTCTVHEPESRRELYARAEEALERAIKAQPEEFDGHYLLARQLAEMREIPRAITAVKESLNLHVSHIPSWHLLALLLSAQKDYTRALEICAIGLKESPWDLAETDIYSAGSIDGDDYLALRITQVMLQNHVHGPESVLAPQEALFALYTKVFAPDPCLDGDAIYDISQLRRQDTSESERVSAQGKGRPRAGSMLSMKSRTSGGGSDIGSNALDRVNYAPSVASAGSSASLTRRRNNNSGVNGTLTKDRTLKSLNLNLPPVIQRPSGKSAERATRANKVLVTLWLLSAATFRRLGRMDDALKAIEEAERVDASNPDVWYQLGLFYEEQRQQETASVAFSKATALDAHHAGTLTRIGKNFLMAGKVEMAESILEATTRSQGWDNAEAWFCLGKALESTHRFGQAKECLWYALDLESTGPIRSFTEALTR
ncbi:hypothetical protein BGZ94_009509 [Podila epigama]|nr:hypothetical protein BGZ94_009509 [Podila epigama]